MKSSVFVVTLALFALLMAACGTTPPAISTASVAAPTAMPPARIPVAAAPSAGVTPVATATPIPQPAATQALAGRATGEPAAATQQAAAEELENVRQAFPGYSILRANVIARVQDEPQGAGMRGLVRMLTLDAGSAQGVQVGMPVMAGCPVGWIVSVAPDSSIVAPIAVSDKPLSVKAPRTRSAGTLRAQTAAGPLVTGFSAAAGIREGDMWWTTGEDGFPRDLMVGQVTALLSGADGQRHEAVIQPACDFAAIPEVFIITGSPKATPVPAVPPVCPAGDSGKHRYVNWDDGYCLLYPANMEAVALGTAILESAGRGVQLRETEPRQNNLTFGIVSMPSGGRSLDQAVSQILRPFPAEVAGEIKRTDGRLGGEPAVILDGPPGKYFIREAFVLHGDRLYQLAVSSNSSPWASELKAEALALWDTVIGSFAFIPQAQPRPAPGSAVTLPETRVTLDAFSGLPDPSWTLRRPQSAGPRSLPRQLRKQRRGPPSTATP